MKVAGYSVVSSEIHLSGLLPYAFLAETDKIGIIGLRGNVFWNVTDHQLRNQHHHAEHHGHSSLRLPATIAVHTWTYCSRITMTKGVDRNGMRGDSVSAMARVGYCEKTHLGEFRRC